MQKSIREKILTPYNSCDKLTDLIVKGIAVIICLITVMMYCMSYNQGSDYAYPLENPIQEYDPYIQQFDAFMKGRLSFDYVPDEEFLKLENPYDPDAREKGTFLYDRAFYKGKYYSYFGTAPIFTVIFPYYFITGKLPAGGVIQIIYLNIFAVFFPLLIMNIIKRFSKKLPAFMAVLITYTAYVSSLSLLMGRGDEAFYYIAANAGMTFLVMFMYFFYKGIYEDGFKKRCIYFIISGLAYTLCFHSRINVAFTAAFFIVPSVIFGIITKKREITRKGIFAELCCLGIPVIIGIVVSMIYNYVRFDNPMEFGATYQLTVADVSTYRLDISEIGKALYCYYIAPIKINTNTGSLVLDWNVPFEMNRYLYKDAYFGIMAIPFMLFSLAVPIVCIDKSKTTAFRVTIITAFVGTMVTSWIDFCLGGLIFRYLCDISVIIAVTASIAVCACLDGILELKNTSVRKILTAIITIFIIICLCAALRVTAVDNHNVFKMRDNALFYKLFN